MNHDYLPQGREKSAKTSLKSEEYSSTPSAPTPVLFSVMEDIHTQLNRMDGLCCSLNMKLQALLPDTEPQNEEPLPSSNFNSFTEELLSEVLRFERYNNRLERSLRHLAKII